MFLSAARRVRGGPSDNYSLIIAWVTKQRANRQGTLMDFVGAVSVPTPIRGF